MKKLSIIIAAYNIEDYISKCLDSLVIQESDDLEIVVVNDGSKDNTLAIINEYAKLDKRIIVVNKENGGIIEARKTGYATSKGEYIWFIDGDDWISNDSVNKIIKYIDSEKYELICFNALKSYDDKDDEIFNINSTLGILEDEEYLKKFLLGNLGGSLWGKVIKKKFIEKYNINFPKNISYADDTCFTLSMAIKKPKVIVLDEYFYYYYQRDNSIMNSENSKILELERANEFCIEQMKNEGFLEKYHEEFEYFLYVHNLKYIVSKIYAPKSKYGDELFAIWSSLNIDLKNNRYFNADEKNNLKLFIKLAYKNYRLGKIIFRIKKVN